MEVIAVAKQQGQPHALQCMSGSGMVLDLVDLKHQVTLLKWDALTTGIVAFDVPAHTIVTDGILVVVVT